jgi:1-phosphofructokinase
VILTVTFNPAVDHTLAVGAALEDGAVQYSDDERFDAGGKGINVSQYVAGLGGETLATGLVGGFTGEYIRTALEGELRTDFVGTDGLTRLNTTVLAGDSEYKVNHRGPDVGGEAVDAVVETLRRHDPDVVAVCGSLPPGLDVSSTDRVAAAGEWATAVDVGGESLAALDGNYAYCKPNEAELAAATGRSVESVPEAFAAARALREQGLERVVASLGGDGAILVGPDAAFHAAAVDVEVVDTVGAGDALFAGVLAASDAGADDEQALRRGVAVASRVVGAAGTSVPAFDGLDEAAAAVELTRES